MMKRCWIAVFLLSLLATIIPACGHGDKSNLKSSAVIPKTMSSSTQNFPPSTPTPVGPVKIGAINSWSGPGAISGIVFAEPIIHLVEKQVADMGGILGGRKVEVVRFDNYGSLDQGRAGVHKLISRDKVSVIVWGGVTADEINAIAEAARKNHVLFVSVGPGSNPGNRYAVSGTFNEDFTSILVDFMINELKAKSIALLADDSPVIRRVIPDQINRPVDFYEEFMPASVTDYSPYLTRVIEKKPEALYLALTTSEQVITIAKQIEALEKAGEWSSTDIKIVCASSAEIVRNTISAQGWYLFTPWMPGTNHPGSIKFVNDYQAMFKREPYVNHVYFYNCLWTAIHAIELAGTDMDREKIVESIHSGSLEWDTPMGHAHYLPDGHSGLYPIMAQIRQGEIVPVTMSDNPN